MIDIKGLSEVRMKKIHKNLNSQAQNVLNIVGVLKSRMGVETKED